MHISSYIIFWQFQRSKQQMFITLHVMLMCSCSVGDKAPGPSGGSRYIILTVFSPPFQSFLTISCTCSLPFSTDTRHVSVGVVKYIKINEHGRSNVVMSDAYAGPTLISIDLTPPGPARHTTPHTVLPVKTPKLSYNNIRAKNRKNTANKTKNTRKTNHKKERGVAGRRGFKHLKRH